jgi:hypothetical protein
MPNNSYVHFRTVGYDLGRYVNFSIFPQYLELTIPGKVIIAYMMIKVKFCGKNTR